MTTDGSLQPLEARVWPYMPNCLFTPVPTFMSWYHVGGNQQQPFLQPAQTCSAIQLNQI